MTDTEIVDMIERMAEGGRERQWIHAESVLQIIDTGRAIQQACRNPYQATMLNDEARRSPEYREARERE